MPSPLKPAPVLVRAPVRPANPNDAFLQGAASAQDAYAAQRMGQGALQPDHDKPVIVSPWDKGGFQVYPVDLSTLGNEVSLGANGYEVQYVGLASTPGGVLFINGLPVFPGMRVGGYFEELRVRRGGASDGALLTSVTSGTAYLVVHKTPQLRYREDPFSSGAGLITSALEAQTTTQAAPSGATEGISLASVQKGWRITVAAAAGQTLSGTGSFDVYYREPTLALWGIDPDLNIPVPASVSGLRVWTAPDIPCLVPTGRGAVAANGVGTSSGNLAVYYSGA